MASSRHLLFVLVGLIALTVAGFPAKAQFGEKIKSVDNHGGDQHQRNVPAVAPTGGQFRARTIPVTFGENVGAVLSPEKDRIWAYSAKYGQWQMQTIDLAGTPKEKLTYVVNNDLVSLQTKARVYCFSARTGQWAVLDVTQDTAVSVQTNPEWVSAEYGDTIALFSATTGRWSTLNWKIGKISEVPHPAR